MNRIVTIGQVRIVAVFNRSYQTNRTLSGTSWTLAYDYEGQLTSTATGGNTVSTFVYDALGRRYSRANGGTTTVFYYGPGGILTEKQGGTFTSAYAYGNGLIRKDGEYPMFDGLGSERTVTNSSQTVTGTIIQDGFGLTVATTGSSTNPYKFAATSGYRDDGDCGLTHVGARYYDAQVGRFITRDTELDQHPFLYCDHDPANYLDSSGHNWLTDKWKDFKDWYLGGQWAPIITGSAKAIWDWGSNLSVSWHERWMIENWPHDAPGYDPGNAEKMLPIITKQQGATAVKTGPVVNQAINSLYGPGGLTRGVSPH